jgi:hypothetical protein
MSPGDLLWTAVLAAIVIFLIVKNRKEVKRGADKLAAGLGYILVFLLIAALLLGAVWGVVAVIHWAWRNS